MRVTLFVRQGPCVHSVFHLASMAAPLHLTYLAGEQRACLSVAFVLAPSFWTKEGRLRWLYSDKRKCPFCWWSFHRGMGAYCLASACQGRPLRSIGGMAFYLTSVPGSAHPVQPARQFITAYFATARTGVPRLALPILTLSMRDV